MQIFLEFANFYKRFIRFYIKIIHTLTKLLKRNKQKKQSKLFIFKKIVRQTFQRFIKTFIKALLLIHFDLKNFIKVEIDASEFVIAAILFYFITFVIDVKQTQ